MTTSQSNTLTFSDAVAAISGHGNPGGWYNGLCPAHNDSTPSLGIKERPDGSFSVKCQTGCTRQEVIAALEQKTGKSCITKEKGKENQTPVERGITLDQYAELKKLPREYLAYFGTVDYVHDGKPCITNFYSDGYSDFGGLKLRLSTDSHDTLWTSGPGPDDFGMRKPFPYGLSRLRCWLDDEPQGYTGDWVVICEGESDVQTLFFNGIPAIGISGKNGWKPEFAELPLLKNLKYVFIVQEPDAEDFVASVTESFLDKNVYVVEMTEPIKDPSALWLQNPTREAFLAAWNKAVDAAKVLNDGFANTDTGNAERLVAMHGGNFRWVDDEETFCAWDKTVWRKNTTGDVLLPATKEVARAIPNDEWRRSSESSSKRHAMIAMVKGEVDVLARRDVFDRHPMLLNVQNGTLDLEKQELRDFCREDFLTKKAPVSYDLFADCPKFDEFMDFTFGGDQDVIHFMDKALGYTLTGNISESIFFMCYGSGANGKTTLLELMMQILGPDFVTPAKFSTFVESRFPEQSSYEIATFAGARMVTASEPRKAGRLNEELLKQLTGGDMMKARQIYGKPFAFYPECKLWFAMNNQPRITGTDEGIWRRVRFIPFLQTVPDDKKVKDYHKVLFNEEGPGILNRLLRGLGAWQEEELQMPGAIAKATADFRAAQNVIQEFFDERTLSGKRGMHAKSGEIYDAYRKWAEDLNEQVMRSNEFAEELKRRGFEKRRVHGDGFHWFGITLKNSPAESNTIFDASETEQV